jgi:hypothetical protein
MPIFSLWLNLALSLEGYNCPKCKKKFKKVSFYENKKFIHGLVGHVFYRMWREQ